MLSLVLSVALDGAGREPHESGGMFVVCGDWSSEDPTAEIVALLEHRSFHGKAVGLIAVAEDMGCGARTLAVLQRLIRERGGIPVGAGLCIDAVDIVGGDGGLAFADITAPARIALLGRRVRTLARGRRVLRAA